MKTLRVLLPLTSTEGRRHLEDRLTVLDGNRGELCRTPANVGGRKARDAYTGRTLANDDERRRTLTRGLENRQGASPRGFESHSLRIRISAITPLLSPFRRSLGWQPYWQPPIGTPSGRWRRWANEHAATAPSITGRTGAGKARSVFRAALLLRPHPPGCDSPPQRSALGARSVIASQCGNGAAQCLFRAVGWGWCDRVCGRPPSVPTASVLAG